MEEKYKNQLAETVQFYFSRRDLNETVNFQYKVPGAGRLIVELHTKELLCYSDLAFIEKLVFALMPIGIMYELVNVSKTPTGREQKLVADGIEFIVSVDPRTLPIEAIPENREFTNVDTSQDVTMPVSKKKGK